MAVNDALCDLTGFTREELLLATCKDVSDLRHVEEEPATTQTDFRALVENVHEVFACYDLDLRFTYVSPVIERWVPLRAEDMVGKSNAGAGFSPDLAELFDEVLHRTLETRAPFAFEYRIAGHDGELVAETHVYPELDAEGRPVALMSITRDVTARARAEQAVRESEAKYRALVERANDAVLLIDAEQCLFANAAAARLSGYAEDELPGLPLATVVAPSAREQLLDRARRRLAGEDMPATYVTDLVRKDGSVIKAEVSAGVIPYEGATANLLIVREVTERERAAAALRRSELMHDTAERVAQTGSYRWDIAGEEVTLSPEMFRLFDVDIDAFDGDFTAVVASRVHPDDSDDVLRAIDESRRSGEPAPLCFRVVHGDGSTHVLEGESHLETGEDGRPLAVVGYYRDATESREAERVLRETEARFRSLFEESPVPVFEMNASALADLLADPSQDRLAAWAARLAADDPRVDEITGVHVVRANQAAVALCRAADAGELAAQFERCLTPHLLATLPSLVDELAAGARRFTRRTRIRTFDGESRTVDLHGSVVAGHEQSLGRVLVSFIDLTEIVHAETEIRRLNAVLEERVASRTAQRDALNRELEAFAYSVSHDVRAPLRAIDGFSAMVMEDAAEKLTAGDVAHLRRVREAAQRMGRLIDDLLGLSRMSRRDLVRSMVDVSALAAEVGEELAEEEPARQVELEVEPGMQAHADPVLLRVVLRELLENAWKFTAREETAQVQVGRSHAHDPGAAFFVRDNGAGFDPRFAGHLFGAFQRLHPVADFPGDGIGLATVQRLVARHGGSVWAHSAPGEGATFWFTLPDEPAKVGRAEP